MSSRTMENTADALGQSIALTREARSELTGQINSLNGKLAGIGVQWQGQGATAFVRVHQAWHEQVGRLLTALDGFEGALLDTERAFEAADVDASVTLNHFASRLG
jgi:WXG100 family type VII secretion target